MSLELITSLVAIVAAASITTSIYALWRSYSAGRLASRQIEAARVELTAPLATGSENADQDVLQFRVVPATASDNGLDRDDLRDAIAHLQRALREVHRGGGDVEFRIDERVTLGPTHRDVTIA